MKNRFHSPLVSVIVPVFNVAPYIREALDSVVSQTYKNLECFLVDDGSTDDSGKICDEYAARDDRFIVIHQEHQGVSAARNAGLDAMRGELVAFLDPDDAYRPEFVGSMVEAMEREEADIVACKYTIHYTTKKITATGHEKTYPTIRGGVYDWRATLKELADSKINVSVWNKLYIRELWKDIRFPVGQLHEDNEATYRIFEFCKKFYVVNQPLYLHRKRPGSITTTISQISINDQILANSFVCSFIEARVPEFFTKAHLQKHRQGFLNSMIINFARCSYESGDEWKTLRAELKNKIIELEKEVGIKNCAPRTRVAFFMFKNCPWLLSPAYKFVWPLLRSLRDFLKGRRG
ncbi:MAG: glycosyltransferase family 2 protein [Synergistaceae bacterium]|nr:glycosyltransferase family 2 protein [Synergistaceae bacterium]